jgi:hypothetical protein
MHTYDIIIYGSIGSALLRTLQSHGDHIAPFYWLIAFMNSYIGIEIYVLYVGTFTVFQHTLHLAHPNSSKVVFVFELCMCKERVENRLALHKFTLYKKHMYPKVCHSHLT